jgi:transposase
MDVVNDVIDDDAKAGFRRVEVLTGPARRRRWSAEEKGQIVAETLRAGATVTEIARRRQICPQQVWGWRREAREGRLTLPAELGRARELPGFVPIVTESSGRTPETVTAPVRTPVIEIRLAEAVVRVPLGTDPVMLGEVLRAVRASAR